MHHPNLKPMPPNFPLEPQCKSVPVSICTLRNTKTSGMMIYKLSKKKPLKLSNTYHIFFFAYGNGNDLKI